MRKNNEAEPPYFLWNLCCIFFIGVLYFDLWVMLLAHSSTSLLNSFANNFLWSALPFSQSLTLAYLKEPGSIEPLLIDFLRLKADAKGGLTSVFLRANNNFKGSIFPVLGETSFPEDDIPAKSSNYCCSFSLSAYSSRFLMALSIWAALSSNTAIILVTLCGPLTIPTN